MTLLIILPYDIAHLGKILQAAGLPLSRVLWLMHNECLSNDVCKSRCICCVSW